MLLEGILFYFFKSCGLNNRWFLLPFEIKVQKNCQSFLHFGINWQNKLLVIFAI